MTEWEYIDGFPGYVVNPLGQVQNEHTGRILRPQRNQFDVAFVGLIDEEGHQKQRSIALLVASAFIPQDLESFNTPINLDGDRQHCSVDNLMWRPRWFAIQYHQQFKRRYPYPIDTPIRDLGTDEIYADSGHVFTTFGLLERDLVTAIELRTYVWPTYQTFDLAD